MFQLLNILSIFQQINYLTWTITKLRSFIYAEIPIRRQTDNITPPCKSLCMPTIALQCKIIGKAFSIRMCESQWNDLRELTWDGISPGDVDLLSPHLDKGQMCDNEKVKIHFILLKVYQWISPAAKSTNKGRRLALKGVHRGISDIF